MTNSNNNAKTGYMANLEQRLEALLTEVVKGGDIVAAVATIKGIVYGSYQAGRRAAERPEGKRAA